MGNAVGVDNAVVLENYKHLNSIARYLCKKDAAKQKVEEAIRSVNAQGIVDSMVSM